jgi:methyl-accepting chemotaxis protein
VKGTRPAILATLMLSLGLLLPAAGCGDDEADQFREDYNAAVDKLSEINSDIGAAAGGAAGQTNSEIAAQFEEIADTAEQTRTDLADLDPPDDAKDEFDDLLNALESGVADLRAVAGAVKANDTEATQEAVEDLTQSGDEISKAEDALKDAVDE